jgi:hypothetical protein
LNTSIKYVCPNLMVWTFRREWLQKAVCIKNDSPHIDKGCACVPRPMLQWCPH